MINKDMKNLRKESLKIRDDVVKFLKEVSDYDFIIEYNDLYKIKDGYEVRRLKGWFGENGRMVEVVCGSDWYKKVWDRVKLNENIWKEYKNKLESIDFGNFKVELNNGGKMFIVKIIYKDF